MDNRINYTVKYKQKGSLFFRKIKGLDGDGLISENGNRYFILSSGKRMEIPSKETIFIFCEKRSLSIQAQMSKEAGQQIKIQ